MSATSKVRDLTLGSVKKHFFFYLAPSIFATLATSIYILVDTIMIGQAEGGDGLLALNIFMPLFSIIMGIGVFAGVGGGVRYSMSIGRGDKENAKRYFTASLIILCVFTVVLFTVLNAFFEPIARTLGASDASIGKVTAYGRYVTWGLAGITGSMFLQAIIRNDNNPRLAMIAVISGGVLNIGLDYVMIFPMGMGIAGGALATVIANTVTGLICLIHFFKKGSGLKLCGGLKWFHFKGVILSGVPSFVIEVAVAFMTFILNRSLLVFIGDNGVVVYSVISNVSFVAISVYNGIAQGAQPIISVNYGAGRNDRIRSLIKTVAFTMLLAELMFFVIMQVFPTQITGVFIAAPSQEVLSIAAYGIRIYYIGALFIGFNIFFTNYYQAVGRSLLSLVLTLLRGVAIGGILAFVLPLLTKTGASIWFAAPVSEFLTLVVCVISFVLIDKRSRGRKLPCAETDGAPDNDGQSVIGTSGSVDESALSIDVSRISISE